MMELSQKKSLLSKIEQLQKKRKHHQKIIEKLLESPKTLPNSVLISPHTHLDSHKSSQMRPGHLSRPTLQTLTRTSVSAMVGPILQTNRSSISNMSKQVNLQMYINNAQESEADQKLQFGQNKLIQSLENQFGRQAVVSLLPKSSGGMVFIDQFIDFCLVQQYISHNSLWEEVFVQDDHHYYAAVSAEFDSNGRDRICLSEDPISESEMQLIYVQQEQNQSSAKAQDVEGGQRQSLSSSNSGSDGSNQNQDQTCKRVFIGYLLLHRLMSYMGSGYAPIVLQNILGFPYQSYNLHQTSPYLSLSNTIPYLCPSQSLILAQKSLNKSLTKLSLQKLKQGFSCNMQILKEYSSVTIMKTFEFLSFKEIKVKHRRNHFAVIDFENIGQGEQEVYVTFVEGCDSEPSRGRDRRDKGIGGGFRYCLLSQDGHILQYSQPLQKNRQYMQIKLAGVSQHKLYIGHHNPCQESCSQLSQFKVIVKSNTQLNNINLYTKLSQSYNTLTETLINKYLSSHPNIDEIENQMIRLSHIQHNASSVIIVRVFLRIMGFAVDFVSLQESQDKFIRKGQGVVIQYEDREVFCDREYKHNRKVLNNESAQIYQIYLSKNSRIKQCSGLPFAFSQIYL